MFLSPPPRNPDKYVIFKSLCFSLPFLTTPGQEVSEWLCCYDWTVVSDTSELLVWAVKMWSLSQLLHVIFLPPAPRHPDAALSYLFSFLSTVSSSSCLEERLNSRYHFLLALTLQTPQCRLPCSWCQSRRITAPLKISVREPERWH